MIKNYLKIALRNIGRHKVFTFINVIGLSIGISAALVIYLIVQHDLSFDKFHPNGNRIYRVVSNFYYSGLTGTSGGVSGAVPGVAATQIPGIEKTAPFFTLYGMDAAIPCSKAPLKFKQQSNTILTDGRFFDVFKYKWLAGSSKKALFAPGELVLTLKQAKLYFPKLSPGEMIGQQVIYDDSIKTTVTGIVADFTENTDLKFHDFISYKTANNVSSLKSRLKFNDWGGTTSGSQLFVQLKANTDPQIIGRKITRIYNKNNPPKAAGKGNSRTYTLQPLDDVHFNAAYNLFDQGNVASKTTLYGLLIIAAFLLILGCINFINLTTAQASQRAKEIGIRKTIGSTRAQLIIQLLSETFLITILAVITSVFCAPLILKLFADFVSPEIEFNLFGHPGIIIFLVLLTLVVGLISGFYPAVVLSGYKPVEVLKNQSAGKNNSRNSWLRKSLTVTQFIIAQFFVMATLLVSKQIYYATHKNMGFKKDAIIYLYTPWKNKDDRKTALLASEISSNPHVQAVSIGSNPPSSNNTNSTEATFKDGKKEIKTDDLHLKFGDENYLRVYGIKLLAGRNIRQSDTSNSFLINETYAHFIGFKNPIDAVGKTVNKFNGDKNMQVIGVVADFQQQSLHEPLKPLAILYHPDKFNNEIIHIQLKPQTSAGHEWKNAIAATEKSWRSIYPGEDFKYTFYDESIRKFYESEQHTSQLLTWASGLSILISCLGLLGLAIYTTNTRTKEIGMRKVLGASVSQIVTLLSAELISLVLLAFIIVTPIAFWAMHVWMQNFADRTTISWWLFGVSGLGMLLTALLTLSSQTIKAALSNPVKSLRSE